MQTRCSAHTHTVSEQVWECVRQGGEQVCSAGMCPESVSGREVSKCAVQTCAQKVWWASVQCSHVCLSDFMVWPQVISELIWPDFMTWAQNVSVQLHHTPRTKEKQEKPDRLSPGNLVDQAVPATVPWHRSVGCQTLSISSKKYEFHFMPIIPTWKRQGELKHHSTSIQMDPHKISESTGWLRTTSSQIPQLLG